MKAEELIKQLRGVVAKHGNVEVSCTAFLGPDDNSILGKGPFESTVENLVMLDDKGKKRVRLYM